MNSKIKYQTLYRTQNDNENVLGIFQFAKSCFFSMTRNFIGMIFASQLICLAGRYAPGGRPSFYRRLLHHWTSQLHAASAFGVWLLSVLLISVFHDLGTDFSKHRWPTLLEIQTEISMIPGKSPRMGMTVLFQVSEQSCQERHKAGPITHHPGHQPVFLPAGRAEKPLFGSYGTTG